MKSITAKERLCLVILHNCIIYHFIWQENQFIVICKKNNTLNDLKFEARDLISNFVGIELS